MSDSSVNAKFSDSLTKNVRLAVGKSNNVYVAIGSSTSSTSDSSFLNGLFRPATAAARGPRLPFR